MTHASLKLCHSFPGSAAFNRTYKSKKESLGAYLVRWFDYIQSLDASQKAAASLQALQVNQKKQDKGATKVLEKKSEKKARLCHLCDTVARGCGLSPPSGNTYKKDTHALFISAHFLS